VDVTGHRSPPDADERRHTPSPLPSPSRRPKGESPIPPPCPMPPRSSHGAHRLDLVAGRAPPGRRQVRHRARTTRGERVASAPGTRTPMPRSWAGSQLGQAEPAWPWAEWPARHCAADFRFSISFKIPKICSNL
jgi:hypothetical protein